MGTFVERVFLLKDGSRARIRALVPDDARLLQAFVRRLSARSRRFRFFTALFELSAGQLQRLVNLDHRAGLAVVAVAERGLPEIIAEARCVVDPTVAGGEFAIAVADDFQRRGLGTQLLQTLVAYASSGGLKRVFGEILVDNKPMLALARRLGFRIEPNPLDRMTMLASIATPSG